MIGSLIRLVRTIQAMDTKVRESSLVGESEVDRQSRLFVTWTCRGIIGILMLIVLVPQLVRYVRWLYFDD